MTQVEFENRVKMAVSGDEYQAINTVFTLTLSPLFAVVCLVSVFGLIPAAFND